MDNEEYHAGCNAATCLKAAISRIRELEAGLAWYANLDNYLGHCPAILSDRGVRASAALAESVSPTI